MILKEPHKILVTVSQNFTEILKASYRTSMTYAAFPQEALVRSFQDSFKSLIGQHKNFI